MGDLTPLVERALDELAPPRPGPDRWPEIERAGRRRTGWAALVPVAAAVLAAVLAWPGGTHRTLLERAAAAIGDGPVLHVVIRSGFEGTEIDLATGSKVTVHGEEELWYDPERGVRDVTRFAGVRQGDELYPPGGVGYLDRTLAFLATDYREALKNGTAKVLGRDTIDGRPVYWVRVDTQMLPDVADGKLHEWAHDVAVSADTARPVATRETRDGQVGPDGISTILSIETLGSGEGDFAAPPSANGGGPMRFQLSGSLTTDDAEAVLGGTMLWPGSSVGGLPLTRIAKQVRSDAAATHTGITLFYGPSTGGGIGEPPPAAPYLQISETTALDDQFQRGVRDYSPPDGKLLVFGDGTIGVMQSHGVHVFLEASDADTLLAAARALAPLAG